MTTPEIYVRKLTPAEIREQPKDFCHWAYRVNNKWGIAIVQGKALTRSGAIREAKRRWRQRMKEQNHQRNPKHEWQLVGHK